MPRFRLRRDPAIPLPVVGLLVVHACSMSADQVQRARELTDDGWWDEAEELLLGLLEKEWIDDATRARVHMDLGFMYQSSEEWPMAAAEFAKALEADSTEMRAVYQLGRTYIFAESNLDEPDHEGARDLKRDIVYGRN